MLPLDRAGDTGDGGLGKIEMCMQDHARLSRMLKDVITSTSWKASATQMAAFETAAGATVGRTLRDVSPTHGTSPRSPRSPWNVQAVHDSSALGNTTKVAELSYSQQFERRRALSPGKRA